MRIFFTPYFLHIVIVTMVMPQVVIDISCRSMTSSCRLCSYKSIFLLHSLIVELMYVPFLYREIIGFVAVNTDPRVTQIPYARYLNSGRSLTMPEYFFTFLSVCTLIPHPNSILLLSLWTNFSTHHIFGNLSYGCLQVTDF
jgi:hypothetical protein